jgi:hypothetical protein
MCVSKRVVKETIKNINTVYTAMARYRRETSVVHWQALLHSKREL